MAAGGMSNVLALNPMIATKIITYYSMVTGSFTHLWR